MTDPLHELPDTPMRRPERRRATWREFRRAYPGVIATMALALVAMLAIDGWLVSRRLRYAQETARLRAGMSGVERRRADVLVAANEDKLKVMIELIRRQALGDKDLHLAIAVDSGVMHLAREGAQLRDMRVDVGPERWVHVGPDTVKMAAPRGTRTVERILGPDDAWEVPAWVYDERGLPVPADRRVKGALGAGAVLLNGGAVIYARPDAGPLADSAYILPGSIRARAADLRAIVPDLKPGMSVYFY